MNEIGEIINHLEPIKIGSLDNQGKLNGKGLILDKNSENIKWLRIGNFKDDQLEGVGLKIFAGGESYLGNYKNDNMCKASILENNGDRYFGQFDELTNERSGKGIIYYWTGDTFIGQFSKNLSFGECTYYWDNGSEEKGKYVNDK